MTGSAFDQPSDGVGDDGDTLTEALHHLTGTQFLRLGVPSVVYFRSRMVDGELAYVIHSADGALKSVVEDIETAMMLASDYGMSVVWVH